MAPNRNCDRNHVMKTLAKIIKVEDNTVYYAEINRTNGKVMIEDYMSVDRFVSALQSDFGFELVKMTKQQAINTAAKLGAEITGWEYIAPCTTFEASVTTKKEYTNIHGYTHKSVGISGRTQSQLCEQAIIHHHTYNGQ